MSRVLHAARRPFGVSAIRNDDLPLEQLSVTRARTPRVGAGPGVDSQVVMISAGRQKERAWITPYHRIKSERRMKERNRPVYVAHVKMHVPHRSARWHSGPRLAIRGACEILCVERLRVHQELTSVVPPRLHGPIGVNLDPESVGVAQIKRLTHRVIRCARVVPYFGQVPEKSPQRRPVGEEESEVVQSKPSTTWDRRRARKGLELDERRVVLVRAQRRSPDCTIEHTEPEHIFVERERASEVRYL